MASSARAPLLSRFGIGARDDGTGLSLPVGIVVSLLLHGLLLAITFNTSPPPTRESMRQLDVTLVNARHERAPDEADILAQANLDGGGTVDDDKARPTTPTPQRQEDSQGDTLTDARQAAPPPAAEAAQTEQAPKTPPKEAAAPTPVLTRQERTSKTPPPPAATPTPNKKPAPRTPSPAPAPKPEPKPPTPQRELPSGADLMNSVAAIARLEAQIDRRLDEYAKRPRKVQIGSRAREHRFAQYAENWRQKVERVGTLNYPQGARGRLYGDLVLTVAIRADGTVESIDIDRSSGHDVLDRAAVDIVRLAAPYGPFPPDIRVDTDIIEITRKWSFTNSDQLRTR